MPTRFEYLCDAYDQLEGDGPQRHCRACDRTVHDLSAMSRADAAALLDGQVGPTCARVELTADLEPVFAPPRSPTRALAVASGALLAVGALAAGAWAVSSQVSPALPPAEPTADRPPEASAPQPQGGIIGATPSSESAQARLGGLIADAIQQAELDAARRHMARRNTARHNTAGADEARGDAHHALAPDHGAVTPETTIDPPAQRARRRRAARDEAQRKTLSARPDVGVHQVMGLLVGHPQVEADLAELMGQPD